MVQRRNDPSASRSKKHHPNKKRSHAEHPTSDSSTDLALVTDDHEGNGESQIDLTHKRLEALPPEIGVMLIVFGITGILLPGPVGTPFVIAGGLSLWPGAFGRVEDWFRHRFPATHETAMNQMERYLDDMEKRYPTTSH